MARGYLADQERTDAVYIKNPCWGSRNGVSRKFYKTGDLVGRKDLQVKIRGQWVEFTEIEAHLRAVN